jgi:hypothetical protein
MVMSSGSYLFRLLTAAYNYTFSFQYHWKKKKISCPSHRLLTKSIACNKSQEKTT